MNGCIQCSLTATTLSWYICLNDTYKQDSPAFVQAFRKTILFSGKHLLCSTRSTKTHKKDSETVSHFALKVQQQFKKTVLVSEKSLLCSSRSS